VRGFGVSSPLLAALFRDRIRASDVQTVAALACLCVAAGVPITSPHPQPPTRTPATGGISTHHGALPGEGGKPCLAGTGAAACFGGAGGERGGAQSRSAMETGLLTAGETERCLWCIGVYAQVLLRWRMLHARAHLLKIAARLRGSARAAQTTSALRETRQAAQASGNAACGGGLWSEQADLSSRAPGAYPATRCGEAAYSQEPFFRLSTETFSRQSTERLSTSIAEEPSGGSRNSDYTAGGPRDGAGEAAVVGWWGGEEGDAHTFPGGPFDQAAAFHVDILLAPAALWPRHSRTRAPNPPNAKHRAAAARAADTARQEAIPEGARATTPWPASSAWPPACASSASPPAPWLAPGSSPALAFSGLAGPSHGRTMLGGGSMSRSLDASPSLARGMLGGLTGGCAPAGALPITHCPVAHTGLPVAEAGGGTYAAKGKRGLGCAAGSHSCGACIGTLAAGTAAPPDGIDRCSAFSRCSGAPPLPPSCVSDQPSTACSAGARSSDSTAQLSRAPACAVCTLPVRGVAWSCGTCGHGGHWPCLRQWFAECAADAVAGSTHAPISRCPTGCGCACGVVAAQA
jgi:hypothetical protein